MEGGFSGRVGGWRRRDRGSRQSPTKDGPLGKRRPRCARRQSLSWRDSVTVAKWRRPTPRSINNSPLSSSVPAGSSIVTPSSWPAAAQTRTARSISWFQTGHCSGRHCHDTGSLGNRNTAASASRCAGRDLHDTTSGASATTSATSVRSRSVLASRVPRFGLASSIVGLRLCGE
jgi:hypothetical protein